MATDGTMFFGTPHHGIPYSAVQFGTMKDLIYLTDYNWDPQGYYRLTTWISKPTQEGIKIIKSLKKAYKEYQRAESKSVKQGKENHHQYVSLHRSIPDFKSVFTPIIRLSDSAERKFANLQRVTMPQNSGHHGTSAMFHPHKNSELLQITKSMFRAQADSMRGYTFQAILSGLYRIKSIRGYHPLNWCSKSQQKNRLYEPTMINRMANHVK
ncbi:hypothetical protein N9M17_00020 [bacterium]|jgi:hypothetical protein|nr:hypothetical protein [bacterium]